DFMHPDRVVIGTESKLARDLLVELYKPLKSHIVVTDIKSAELIKHASNSFLATKISFINAVSRICDKVGADVTEVAYGMGLDKRIGPGFLNAGIGYGGSCFPKDLDAFIHISEKIGYDFKLLKSVRDINIHQQSYLLQKIKEHLWILKDKHIGILGISFKPDTDDIRSAPSINIVNYLEKEGAHIKLYDPSAMPKARKLFEKVAFCKDAYAVARESDCLLILTEWDEFKALNLARIKNSMKRPLIIDGRNMFRPQDMQNKGFTYISIGRQPVCGK
ncbi:MAG: nucleotide sugar dehydrogenase, partial [Candidatus Omnitrophica bacterium]|nr:nucleotide sugar dehydrogenase [Candidatus Omnitrophota bacterium]